MAQVKVILREDVPRLGDAGEVVSVRPGFARNFLLPQGKAMAVNTTNKAMIDKERKAAVARAAKEKSEAEELAARIAGLRFVAPRKVGENEQLYGSVTAGDVGDFLKGKGIDLDKRKVQIEDAIKKLGDHEVKIRIHPEVLATLKVLVTKEG